MGRRRKLDDRATRHDPAYRRAKSEGYAGRAVFKLEEIDNRFGLITRGKRVLDLGCWPGSWMQYAAAKVGEDGLVVGVDLKPVDLALPDWAKSAVGDVEQLDPARLTEPFGRFDVVLSDMAPHTTGDKGSDQWRSEELFLHALRIARGTLRPGGHFAAKVFQGGRFSELLKQLRGTFQEVKPYHAKHTRSSSIEQYVVARGMKPS